MKLRCHIRARRNYRAEIRPKETQPVLPVAAGKKTRDEVTGAAEIFFIIIYFYIVMYHAILPNNS